MTTETHELTETGIPTAGVHSSESGATNTQLGENLIANEGALLLPIAPNVQQPSFSTDDLQLQERLKREVGLALASIEDVAVRDLVDKILREFILLFSRLSLVACNLRKLDTLRENLSIFDLLQVEIHKLVQFIRFEAMNTEGIPEELHEVLDGITWGIGHDVKRVFEGGVLSDIETQSTPVVYGKVLHAHGLLTNCLQQSAITLIQTINPNVDPLNLFDDHEERLRQSLALYADLSLLMRVVHFAQSDPSPDNLRAVAEFVVEFRDGSMQFLMYRDWRGYEELAEELINAIEHNQDTKDLLHRFASYLEVLYGDVKMRSVLRNLFSSSRTEENTFRG